MPNDLGRRSKRQDSLISTKPQGALVWGLNLDSSQPSWCLACLPASVSFQNKLIATILTAQEESSWSLQSLQLGLLLCLLHCFPAPLNSFICSNRHASLRNFFHLLLMERESCFLCEPPKFICLAGALGLRFKFLFIYKRLELEPRFWVQWSFALLFLIKICWTFQGIFNTGLW